MWIIHFSFKSFRYLKRHFNGVKNTVSVKVRKFENKWTYVWWFAWKKNRNNVLKILKLFSVIRKEIFLLYKFICFFYNWILKIYKILETKIKQSKYLIWNINIKYYQVCKKYLMYCISMIKFFCYVKSKITEVVLSEVAALLVMNLKNLAHFSETWRSKKGC